MNEREFEKDETRPCEALRSLVSLIPKINPRTPRRIWDHNYGLCVSRTYINALIDNTPVIREDYEPLPNES